MIWEPKAVTWTIILSVFGCIALALSIISILAFIQNDSVFESEDIPEIPQIKEVIATGTTTCFDHDLQSNVSRFFNGNTIVTQDCYIESPHSSRSNLDTPSNR